MKSKDYEFKSMFKMAVSEIICDYRSKGATYQEIADRLNKDKVETFRGIGKWHAQSVYNVIKNPVNLND